MTIPKGSYPCSLGKRDHHYHRTPRCPDDKSGTKPNGGPGPSSRTPKGRALAWAAKMSASPLAGSPIIPQIIIKTLFDKETPYSLAADKVLDQLPWHHKLGHKLGSHWLCKLLDNAAETLSPDTYAELIREDVRSGLRASGMPEFAAEAIAETSKQFASKGIAAALGPGAISDTLRVIGLLVCPDISCCPQKKAVATTMLKPAVQQTIKDSLA